VDFGAFVRLRSGVEGLLHVTEMADITPDHPQSLVSPGDLLLLRVLRIEPDRRRIGLSLRQVSETEWAEWAAQYHQKHVEDAGAVVETGEDVPPAAGEVEDVPPAVDEIDDAADVELVDEVSEPVAPEGAEVAPEAPSEEPVA
jgi:small subunit ribosomal protein S1